MPNNTQTLSQTTQQSTQTFSALDFPAKTLAIVAKDRGYLAKGRNSFSTVWTLRGQLNLSTSSLKKVQYCLLEEWETSSQSYTDRGTMQNGFVYQARNFPIPKTAKGYSLLPTPCAKDAATQYSSHQALLQYLTRGHQEKLLYTCQLAGLTDLEILQLYAEVMSFPSTIFGYMQ